MYLAPSRQHRTERSRGTTVPQALRANGRTWPLVSPNRHSCCLVPPTRFLPSLPSLSRVCLRPPESFFGIGRLDAPCLEPFPRGEVPPAKRWRFACDRQSQGKERPRLSLRA